MTCLTRSVHTTELLNFTRVELHKCFSNGTTFSQLAYETVCQNCIFHRSPCVPVGHADDMGRRYEFNSPPRRISIRWQNLAASPRKPANWLRGQDLNLRPSGYEPDELPGCSTPRYMPRLNNGLTLILCKSFCRSTRNKAEARARDSRSSMSVRSTGRLHRR